MAPGKPFLTAAWNHLVMANYEVKKEVLLPFLPANTELDMYNGQLFVSLIGFMFEDTRLMGVKIPFHVNFEEVNLRFYVRYRQAGSWKRGVVFIKEFVPKPAISFIANTFYNEQYSTVRMKHFRRVTQEQIHLGYHWRHGGRWHRLEATTTPGLVSIAPNGIEEFITEHYWGYSRYAANTTVEYEVVHPRWEVYRVTDYTIDCDFTGLYGPAFSFLQQVTPHSVLVARGSPISIRNKRTL